MKDYSSHLWWETNCHSYNNNKEDIKFFVSFAKNTFAIIFIMICGTQGKEGDIIADCE